MSLSSSQQTASQPQNAQAALQTACFYGEWGCCWPCMTVPARATVQPEEEAGILGTIAGTPYSGTDEDLDPEDDAADDSDDSEDDEWLGEDADPDAEADEDTEGVNPYEESDEAMPSSATSQSQHSKGL